MRVRRGGQERTRPTARLAPVASRRHVTAKLYRRPSRSPRSRASAVTCAATPRGRAHWQRCCSCMLNISTVPSELHSISALLFYSQTLSSVTSFRTFTHGIRPHRPLHDSYAMAGGHRPRLMSQPHVRRRKTRYPALHEVRMASISLGDADTYTSLCSPRFGCH